MLNLQKKIISLASIVFFSTIKIDFQETHSIFQDSVIKVATSTSKIDFLTDNDDINKISDKNEKQDRCDWEISSNSSSTNNRTSSEFPSSAGTSSYSSEVNLPLSSLSMTALTSNLALTSLSNDGRPKSFVRNFLRKIFGPSSTSSHPQRSKSVQTNLSKSHHRIDQLPVTQGPIRLLVLRHAERLDRYYSSQWLRQAFDKDGNYCRFSPILP